MVLEAGIPVIPAAVIDTDKVMPLGATLPRVHRVGVVIGEPLDFHRFQGMQGDRFVLRSITDEILREMHKLGSQEYVDVYASTIRNPQG
jgi:1-acyl-sn-glycerol-3-phosphate acyltransferase